MCQFGRILPALQVEKAKRRALATVRKRERNNPRTDRSTASADHCITTSAAYAAARESTDPPRDPCASAPGYALADDPVARHPAALARDRQQPRKAAHACQFHDTVLMPLETTRGYARTVEAKGDNNCSRLGHYVL